MRTSFLAVMMVALVASTMTAASAFNWAYTGARSVGADIVDDNNAYLSIDEVNYGCYVDFLSTGKIDVDFDSGTTCAGTGTGINAGSTYFYHDVLKVTNKGTVTLSTVWMNLTAGEITFQTATTASSMTTGGTFAASATASNLAVGSSIWIGFKLNASATDKTASPLGETFTVDARSST